MRAAGRPADRLWRKNSRSHVGQQAPRKRKRERARATSGHRPAARPFSRPAFLSRLAFALAPVSARSLCVSLSHASRALFAPESTFAFSAAVPAGYQLLLTTYKRINSRAIERAKEENARKASLSSLHAIVMTVRRIHRQAASPPCSRRSSCGLPHAYNYPRSKAH